LRDIANSIEQISSSMDILDPFERIAKTLEEIRSKDNKFV